MANLYAGTTDFKDPILDQGIVKQTKQQTILKYTELAKFFQTCMTKLYQL